MVPPFLAYYGVVTGNKTLISEAVNQISLYRKNLKESNGLWKHIVLGSSDTQDGGHWSTGVFVALPIHIESLIFFSFTGNAWAAAGIVRVLATIKHSSFAGDFKTEQSNLASWASEIHSAFYTYQVCCGHAA